MSLFLGYASRSVIVNSGYVTAKFDEGLPTEADVTSVTINGVAANLGAVDGDVNRLFSSAQQIPTIGRGVGRGVNA